MKIIYNLIGTGLGNNGGSRTLIKCAETMQDLGHEVSIAVSEKVRYTWHKIKVPVEMVKNVPSCDAVIASGIHSVPSTELANAPMKAYYIRGYETWRVPEKELIASYTKLPCVVNSPWLQDKLLSHGISSELIFQGLDLHLFNNHKKPRKDIVGAIYHKKHETKRHKDAIAIAGECRHTIKLLNKDIINPTDEQLNDWYNDIKVWVSPTESEGLHNPPMEAGLAGCALLCSNHPQNGIPYAEHMTTALMYPPRDIRTGAKYLNMLMESDDLRERLAGQLSYVLRKKIGDRRTNMIKFIEFLTTQVTK